MLIALSVWLYMSIEAALANWTVTNRHWLTEVFVFFEGNAQWNAIRILNVKSIRLSGGIKCSGLKRRKLVCDRRLQTNVVYGANTTLER